jgi:hypothetical protein
MLRIGAEVRINRQACAKSAKRTQRARCAVLRAGGGAVRIRGGDEAARDRARPGLPWSDCVSHKSLEEQTLSRDARHKPGSGRLATLPLQATVTRRRYRRSTPDLLEFKMRPCCQRRASNASPIRQYAAPHAYLGDSSSTPDLPPMKDKPEEIWTGSNERLAGAKLDEPKRASRVGQEALGSERRILLPCRGRPGGPLDNRWALAIR